MRGLKENVIMGRLIPAGTGMDYYRQIALPPEPVAAEPAEGEGLGLDGAAGPAGLAATLTAGAS
jgi:hypothetical protein